MKKKKSRRIAKILASLAIVISLGSVIAWHLMMDAQAHDYSKEDVGGSKHFESGEALIRINGPSGTSELWVKIISNDYNKVWYTKGSGKKKKTYYYKVRAIKKAGKKVTYSKYSKAVSVKIKK